VAPESYASAPKAPTGLTIDVDDAASDALTMRLAGEVELATSHLLIEAISGIELDGRRVVVLDLTDVTFCDARGLAAVLTAHRTISGNGGHLTIRGASGIVRRIFTLTGVDQALDIG
jgi:anti-sigma B factor antagonist